MKETLQTHCTSEMSRKVENLGVLNEIKGSSFTLSWYCADIVMHLNLVGTVDKGT